MDRGTLNVSLLGLAFLLLFISWQTMANIEATLLASATDPDSEGYVEDFSGSAFTSLALVYAASAVANWLAPSIIAHLGLRPTLALSSLPYTLFVFQLLMPNTILLYLSSIAVGVGAACLWTAQGVYLTLNSKLTHMQRNMGLFWAMFQCSLLIGNSFVFVQFRGSDDIDKHTRTVTLAVLTVVAVASNLVFILLRPAISESSLAPSSPWRALQLAGALAATREMLELSLSFVYLGLVLTFWSGVYGPCLGFTLAFGPTVSKSLVGLHGIVVGVGEIVGGLLGLFKYNLSTWTALVLHLIAFALIALNLPQEAPFGDTHASGIIDSNAWLAIFCSLLLGLGDASYNTNVMAVLGKMYSANSAPAFAIFKFAQGLAAAIAFYYSNHFDLRLQLAIMAVFGVAAGIGFRIVAEKARQKAKKNDKENRSNTEQPTESEHCN